MDKENASKRLVVVGRVLSPHGMMGEFQVEVASDSPGRFSSGGILYINGQAHKIQSSSRLPRGRLALKLEEINSRNEAESLRDGTLTVPEDMVPPLPEGDYYHFQLMDMRVYTLEREFLGQITQILSTGNNDVYVVALGGKELLIPALDDVIRELDVENGTMTVDLPEGLRPSR